ncbi:MAG: hypothetical protein IJZ26_02505 [Clostridia bacterium]|nr:hypothetical protein [Clostridia bacterium]
MSKKEEIVLDNTEQRLNKINKKSFRISLFSSVLSIGVLLSCVGMFVFAGGVGPKGSTGATGAAGADGSLWLTGTAEPQTSQGKIGDLYLDTVTYEIYLKYEAGWASVGNIKGVDGEVGLAGATWLSGLDIPSVDLGKNGDFYLNKTTYGIYEKNNGVWEQVTILAVEKDKEIKTCYYSGLTQALAVVENSDYDNQSLMVSKEDAGIAIQLTENETPKLVILKDSTLTEQLEISSDVIIDLAGKTLAFENDIAINILSGNVTINGSEEGSQITVSNGVESTTVIKVGSGSCNIIGGKYESNSNGLGTSDAPNKNIIVGSEATITINNAKIIANDETTGTLNSIYVEKGGKANISNTEILAASPFGLNTTGINNFGTMVVSNCDIKGYANYTANEEHTDYASSSQGIRNNGILTLKKCSVWGTHSGIRSLGILYINGGTYEGYGHGGIYFAGGGTTSYVKNAYIGETEMPTGYYDDGIAGTNYAGFYIGGVSNVTVYMDNCSLYGVYYPLVMRDSGGEENNALYISNSSINEDFERYIRTGNETNKLYIGVGNNFNGPEHVYLESSVVDTNIDYFIFFPDF